MCHWIATGISLPSLNAAEVGDAVKLPSSLGFSMSFGLQINSNITEIMPYFAPSPPPKTGLHRYVFVLLAPSSNEDSSEIDLKKPKARPHWGYKKIGKGVKKWAKDNELKVIGKYQATEPVQVKWVVKRCLDTWVFSQLEKTKGFKNQAFIELSIMLTV